MKKALAALLLLVLVSCTEQPPTGGEILRVGSESRSFSIYNPSPIVLYGDGRLVTAAPSSTNVNDPAFPSLSVRKLTAEGIDALVAAAEEAGFAGDDVTLAGPQAGDPLQEQFSTVTTFTLNDGSEHKTKVEDLRFYFGGRKVAFEVRDARLRALDFFERLQDPEAWLPNGSMGESQPERPGRLMIQITRTLPGPQQLAWPLGDLAEAGSPVQLPGQPPAVLPPAPSCLVVEGDDVAKVAGAAGDARIGAVWTSEGQRYSLILRPLVDGEPGCPA